MLKVPEAFIRRPTDLKKILGPVENIFLLTVKYEVPVFIFSISLIADGPQRCHPACGH